MKIKKYRLMKTIKTFLTVILLGNYNFSIDWNYFFAKNLEMKEK